MNLHTNQVSVEEIFPDPENTNRHTEEKIEILARNIKEFGLLHPIIVRPDITKPGSGEIRFLIVAGEGRYRAWRKIWAEEKAEKWERIPTVILEDLHPEKDWGRRLSENRLRSFSWVAEAQNLAKMRGNGMTPKQMRELFGYSQQHLTDLVHVGAIPTLNRLLLRTVRNSAEQTGEVAALLTFKQARNYLLPIRSWPVDVPKDKKNMDLELYNYEEVNECIDRICAGEFHDENGELNEEKLAAYVRERQGSVAEKEARDRLDSLMAREIVVLREQLREKDSYVKKLKKDHEKEITRRQVEATKALEVAISTARDEYAAQAEALRSKLEDLEAYAGEDDELRAEIARLTLDKEQAETRLLDMENDMAVMHEQVRLEVEEEIRAGVIERLREELTEEITEEQEASIKAVVEGLTAEQKKFEAQRAAFDQKLLDQKAKLNRELEKFQEEKQRWDEEKQRATNTYSLPLLLSDFNEHGWKFHKALSALNCGNLLQLMEKDDFKLVAGVLTGVSNQLSILDLNLKEREKHGREDAGPRHDDIPANGEAWPNRAPL